MKPNLGLPDAHREGVLRILNPLLADEYLLLTRTRGYRWNVVGLQFGVLQRFFGEQLGSWTGWWTWWPAASGRWAGWRRAGICFFLSPLSPGGGRGAGGEGLLLPSPPE